MYQSSSGRAGPGGSQVHSYSSASAAKLGIATNDNSTIDGEGDGLGSERLSQTAPGVRQRARSEQDSAGVGAAESGGSLTGTCPCCQSAACSQYADRVT